MSDNAKPKNPAEWVDSIGLRGAVAHIAEIIYETKMLSQDKPWAEIPDNIKKPEGHELPGGPQGNLDPSAWQITRMPEEPKLWQIVDAKNMKIAQKFPDRELAQEYVDWGRANRITLTAKPIGNQNRSSSNV